MPIYPPNEDSKAWIAVSSEYHKQKCKEFWEDSTDPDRPYPIYCKHDGRIIYRSLKTYMNDLKWPQHWKPVCRKKF